MATWAWFGVDTFLVTSFKKLSLLQMAKLRKESTMKGRRLVRLTLNGESCICLLRLECIIYPQSCEMSNLLHRAILSNQIFPHLPYL